MNVLNPVSSQIWVYGTEGLYRECKRGFETYLWTSDTRPSNVVYRDVCRQVGLVRSFIRHGRYLDLLEWFGGES